MQPFGTHPVASCDLPCSLLEPTPSLRADPFRNPPRRSAPTLPKREGEREVDRVFIAETKSYFKRALSNRASSTNLCPLTLPFREGRSLLRGGFLTYCGVDSRTCSRMGSYPPRWVPMPPVVGKPSVRTARRKTALPRAANRQGARLAGPVGHSRSPPVTAGHRESSPAAYSGSRRSLVPG